MSWFTWSWWDVFGFFGQIVFAGRFVLQWIVSEIKGRSVVPVQFWMLSLAGTSILLIYAIHLRDPVFIVGQAMGSFIYIRNLMLIHKEKTEEVNGEQR